MGAGLGLLVTSAALFVWRWTLGRCVSSAQHRNLYIAACLGVATSAYIHLSSDRQLHQGLMGSRCVSKSQEPQLTSEQGATTVDRRDMIVQQR
jgi:predicted exporter